jgi:hypothetical protein
VLVVGFGCVNEGGGVEMAVVVLDERGNGRHGFAAYSHV